MNNTCVEYSQKVMDTKIKLEMDGKKSNVGTIFSDIKVKIEHLDDQDLSLGTMLMDNKTVKHPPLEDEKLPPLEDEKPIGIVRGRPLWEVFLVAYAQLFACGVCRKPLSIDMHLKDVDSKSTSLCARYQVTCGTCVGPNSTGIIGLISSAQSTRLRKAVTQNFKCAWCTNWLPPSFHEDHGIPTRWDGPDVEWNRQLLCGNCHAIKSAHETSLSSGGSSVQSNQLQNEWGIARMRASTAIKPVSTQIAQHKNPVEQPAKQPEQSAEDSSDDSSSEESSKHSTTESSDVSGAEQKKKPGRPLKYFTEAERKAAKSRQTVDCQRRQGYANQRRQQKNNHYKNQSIYHQRTGYAAQKKYRERKKEEERLRRMAQFPSTQPIVQPPQPDNAAQPPLIVQRPLPPAAPLQQNLLPPFPPTATLQQNQPILPPAPPPVHQQLP